MSINSLPMDYEKFKPIVKEIKEGDLKPRFLGSGSESNVYELVLEDKVYAVKFAQRYLIRDRMRDTVQATQRKIDAGIRGLGMAGLEQIQAGSTEDGVAVFDYIEGVEAWRLKADDLANVTEEQVKSLYNTIDQAVEAGIEFDPWNQDGSNALYSPDKGFTLIDYFVNYAKSTPEESRINGYKALGRIGLTLVEMFGER